jgi:putative ABC transport system permease protein
MKLVAISIVIALPVAYWFMSQWLTGFPYRISIRWWVFALASLAVVLIALTTITLQSLKAAFMNPVKSLRTE